MFFCFNTWLYSVLYWFSLFQFWLLQLHLYMTLLYSYSFQYTLTFLKQFLGFIFMPWFAFLIQVSRFNFKTIFTCWIHVCKGCICKRKGNIKELENMKRTVFDTVSFVHDGIQWSYQFEQITLREESSQTNVILQYKLQHQFWVQFVV